MINSMIVTELIAGSPNPLCVVKNVCVCVCVHASLMVFQVPTSVAFHSFTSKSNVTIRFLNMPKLCPLLL